MATLKTTTEIIISADADLTVEHPNFIHVSEGNALFDVLPKLNLGGRFPREVVDVIDPAGHEWTFAFVFRPEQGSDGTGSGFFLTGTSEFLEHFNLKAGDALSFEKQGRNIFVYYRRAGGAVGEASFPESGAVVITGEKALSEEVDIRPLTRRVLKLGSRCKVIHVE